MPSATTDMKSCLIATNTRRKAGKVANVRFKAAYEIQDIQLIETRHDLSPQAKNERWYQISDINAMKRRICFILRFIKERGIESDVVQVGLEMDVFDLCGLERVMDASRHLRKHIARNSILKYHREHKNDTLGLSLVSLYETESARRLAWDAGFDDALEAKKEYVEFLHRIIPNELDNLGAIGYGSSDTKQRKRLRSVELTEAALILSNKRAKNINIPTRGKNLCS